MRCDVHLIVVLPLLSLEGEGGLGGKGYGCFSSLFLLFFCTQTHTFM